MCRKYSAEIKLVLIRQECAVGVQSRMKKRNYKDVLLNREVVSQKEINNLLGSFCTTEKRFRNIILTARDLKVFSMTKKIYNLIIIKFQNFCGGVLSLAQSVVSCVKLLCEWLAFIEPPKLTEAVYEFRRACKSATQPEVETSLLPTEVCACIFTCVVLFRSCVGCTTVLIQIY